MSKKLENINLLRGSMSFHEVQDLIITIMSGDSTAHVNNVQLVEVLKNFSPNELRELFYQLNEDNRHSNVIFSDSIESLALEIFNKYGKEGSLLDLGSGTGHMLYRAFNEYGFKDLHGEEINVSSFEISKLFLGTKDIDINIHNLDSTKNFNSKKKYDFIYSEAPFMNMPQSVLKDIAENAGEKYIKTKSNLYEWVFVNRVIQSLSDEGIGVVLLRDSALFSQRDRDIRQELVDRKLIKSVIQLPEQLMVGTSISTTLLVLQKHSNDYVSFVDATNEFVKKGRMNNIFSTDNINKIIDSINIETDISINESEEKIKENEFILSPNRYINNIDEKLINPVNLVDITQTIRGKDIPSKILDEDKDNDKVGYLLNLSDIDYLNVNQPKQQIGKELFEANSNCKLEENDIVISTRSSSRKLGIVNNSIANDNVIISSNFNIIRITDHSISPYYLLAFLTSNLGNEQFKQLESGSAIKVISQKALNDYKISILDKNSQELISEKMEDELLRYQTHLRKIKQFNERVPHLFDDYTEVE